MVAQQGIREAHVALAVHHGGMVMVDAIREFRRWAEVAVADIKMAECLDIVVDAVVVRLAFLEFVGTFHLHDVHLVVIAPKAVDWVAFNTTHSELIDTRLY